MNAQTNPTSNPQSSLYLDLNTLKQRRFQYKVSRKFGDETPTDNPYNDLANPASSKIQSQEPCLSDRAHHVMPRVQTHAPMTPTYTRHARDRSAQGFHDCYNEQMYSEPSQPVNLTQNQCASSPLTPIKNSTLMLIETAQQSRQDLDGSETGNETPRIQTLSQGPMSPEGKCYSEPSIFHKDLTSYRKARQLAKSPGGFARSNSVKETSEYQDMNDNRNLERTKTSVETDRRGHITGLERFYDRNLEVLEEDEGHSDDGRDGRDALGFETFGRIVSSPSATVSLRNSKTKTNNTSGISNKALDRSMGNSRKAGGATPSNSSRVNGKKDAKELAEHKMRTIGGFKKVEETQKQKLQRTFEEEPSKLITQEDSTVKGRNSSTVLSQKSNSTRKLQLNNWAKPGNLDSANSSSRNSPRARQKEVAATNQNAKKLSTVESPKKKVVESKVAKIFKKSPTVQLGSGNNGPSIGNTAILDDSEFGNNVSNTVADVIGGSESKNWSTFRRASDLCNNIVSSSNALNIKTRKQAQKVDVKPLKLPLNKDTEISKIPLESETDRDQKISSRERDSSLGKQGGTTRESTNRKESLIKIANESMEQISTPGTSNNTKKAYVGVRKGLNENNSSPNNKREKEDTKDSLDKAKTVSNPSKMVKNGVTPTHTKNGAIAASSLFGGSYAKMKSPINKPLKGNEKPVESHTKGALNKTNTLQKSMKSPKDMKETKNSIDCKNLDDLKLPAGDKSIEIERPILQFEARKVETTEIQAPQEGVEEKQEIITKEAEVTDQEKKAEVVKTEASEVTKPKQENKLSPNLKVSPQLLKALGLPSLIKGKNI